MPALQALEVVPGVGAGAPPVDPLRYPQAAALGAQGGRVGHPAPLPCGVGVASPPPPGMVGGPGGGPPGGPPRSCCAPSGGIPYQCG